ncbi:P-loop containing nucleoside triphosphate hydrolase protein [Sparassis latifolia]
MASLEKLAIRGIRSFDDKQISVIEFFTPVTVIVGHNGSGKTTIIECLKYATTGDQPPNTRGGAFVHDPKMANEKEVKAQVKLRFTAANDNSMLVVRNLSVTLKKNGAMTMKTLESILALADSSGSKRGVISTKCAEMDAEIPHLLGVSKAVLENVIFCHQEDSYWPLSEPSALKKKFDDIFEATKYTKALDSIKALRKDRVADLKAEKERLEALSREKQHADKIKSRVSDMTGTISAKQMEYDELKKQYEYLVKANAKFYESATKFREIYVKIDNLNEKKAHYQEELASARENLQELSGTDEELADRLQNFDENVAKQRQRCRVQNQKLQDVNDELAAARKAHVDLMNEQGRLESDEKTQEQRIADRESSIRDISAKYQIKGFDHSPLSREQIQDFIVKLGDLRRRQHSETNRLQGENKAKNDEYNEKSRHLHTELQGFKQQKLSIRDRVANHQSNITRTQDEVDRAQVLDSELHALRADMEEKEHRIESIKADLRAGKYEERLAEVTAKGRNLDTKREELNIELGALSRQSDARARLNLTRTELKNRTSELKNLLEFNNPKFRKLVGLDAQPDSMERDLERVVGEKEREHIDLEKESNIASKNLQAAESNLSNLKSQVKSKQNEIKVLDKKLKDGLSEGDANNVGDAISDANKEISTRNEELGKSAGAHELYKRLLQVGKTKKCCPLCTRSMNDQEIVVYDRSVSTPTADTRLHHDASDTGQRQHQEILP